MTIDKSNNVLYEARKHYWALQTGIIQANDMSSALNPTEGQLIADNGADNANANEYASLYQSENMGLGASIGNIGTGLTGLSGIKNIAFIIIILVLLYLAYKKFYKKETIIVHKVPVT